MPLYWDDDEEDLTEIEYRKKQTGKVVVHEEITSPTGKKEEIPPQPIVPPPTPAPVVPRPFTPPAPRLNLPHSFHPAPLKDRFAAFLLDSLLGFYLYWLTGYFLAKFFGLSGVALLHQSSGRFWIHVGLTALLFFFYYLLMEGVFGATLGKFFCRLRVIEESGQGASLGNIFIRNFLRIVDYLPFFLIAVIAMESSPANQRLGDRAAKTLVIKKTRRLVPAVDLARTPLASTLSRLFAEGVDCFLALLFLYGLVLMMRPARPLLSYVIWISLPVIFILYYTLLEFFSGTTPGKVLFKRTVVLENGEPPDGTASLLRNIFRPCDYLLGYPLMVLSRRKQRLGDMAGDTLVVVRSSSRRGVWLSLVTGIVILFTVVLGFKNPDNIIRKDYGLGPWEGWKVFVPGFRKKVKPSGSPTAAKSSTPTGPAAEAGPAPQSGPIQRSALPPSTSDRLKLAEFYFSAGPEPAQIRQNTVFRPGDLIYAFFKIQGFQINPQGQASVSQDLRVEDPNGKVLIDQPKIVEWAKPLEEKISQTGQAPGVLFANQVKLSPNPLPGQYRAIFTVRDQVSETYFSFEKFFEIK